MSDPTHSKPPVIVLKFGGSVLRTRADYDRCVAEAYRFRSEGSRVLAVVSALSGETDRVLARAAELPSGGAPFALSAIGALPDRQSAAELAFALERSGVPATSLSPESISLVAEGAAERAHPCSVETRRIEAAFDRDEVVVVPGFCAEDAEGRPVLLGRGGSDLTALFLAHALRSKGHVVRCRLLKDVDGLYTHDPSAIRSEPARRYAEATWEDARNTDGTILQSRAIEYAASVGFAFEVAAIQGVHASLIGAEERRLAEEEPPRPPLEVAIHGAGKVGIEVFRALRLHPDRFRVKAIVVRDASTTREGVPPELLRTDPIAVLEQSDLDLWIDASAGLEPACAALDRASELGVKVVTANKLAHLHAATKEVGSRATVGGSVPVLEAVRRLPKNADRVIVRGVLNGTANFVIEQIANGVSAPIAIATARALGLAERDTTADLSGEDAARKLCLIARALGLDLAVDRVHRSVIDLDQIPQHDGHETSGVRQVATLQVVAGEIDRSEGALEALTPEDPLFSVSGAGNAVSIEVVDRGSTHLQFLRGVGAGPVPTSLSVMADVWNVWRAHVSRVEREECPA